MKESTLQHSGKSLEETRQAEERICPQCSYRVTNPMTDRCPRCFARIDRVETNCGSCTHQGNCEIAHIYHKHEKNA